MVKMVKIGLYLPVYGGWFPSRKSAKVEADGVYFEKEDEKPPTYDCVRKVALEAEKIGIDSLWIPDHMLNPIKGENAPSLEAWTLATAIAEVTEKVIIAHTTLCEAFRYQLFWQSKLSRWLKSVRGGSGLVWGRAGLSEGSRPMDCHSTSIMSV